MSKQYTNAQFTKYVSEVQATWKYNDDRTSFIMNVTGGEIIPVDIIEFTVEEWPGKVFGIWSEEACWVRNVGKPPEEIQYGYSEHGPYWEQDPYIFWDVLDPDEDPTVRTMIDEMKPTGDYDEHIKMLGLELNWAE